jgi:benzoyl-CoA reductase/2-hydroxyglutaryl-CoA dehydratase subunit BcrC/BadD/HgdB
VEKLTGVTITAEGLKEAIAHGQRQTPGPAPPVKLRKADPAPISGLDALLANQVAFYDNPARFTESVNKICDELEARIADKVGVAPKKPPGCSSPAVPMAVPNWKLPMDRGNLRRGDRRRGVLRGRARHPQPDR